jgi:hypothetical protein
LKPPRPIVRLVRLLALLSSITVACDAGDDPVDGSSSGDASPDARIDAPSTVSGGVPCDVAAVLEENCITCHADIPRFGAPMPLTSHDALTAPTPSDLSTPVYEMIGMRIHDPEEPMPPPTAGELTDEEKAILDGYVADMAPTRPTGSSCGEMDGGMPDGGMMGGVGPEHLPCTPSHTFTAHAAGSSEPFAVPETADNLYQCFAFASPFAPGSQATAWAPIIDDDRVLHHWILYRTATPQTDGAVERCNMPSDATFVTGWAPGGGNYVMPDDVGLELGRPDDYYILQIHYWNAAGLTDSVDRSGVAICATESPRANEAGVLWLGTPRISIPPRSSDVTITNNCPGTLTSLLTAPLEVLSAGPHMHQLGSRFITEIHPGGDRGRAVTMVEVDPWDFDNQTSYPVTGMVINPGDAIETRCTYDNTTDSTVTFGERTEDEMCFNFITVYPLSALPTDERRACLAF